jgi:UDP-N-acetylmuramoyl-tripeptide--D-alanyl-D-alanine ligase
LHKIEIQKNEFKRLTMELSELYQLYMQHPVITTDSRNCPEGSIFVALKGELFDGNKFAASALQQGCSYAVVDESEYAEPGNGRYILVADALVAFKQLAREHRRQFNIPVIGITGTNGKTTTKELVSAVLAERFCVLHTEGNFNNDVGVPKTLLRIAPQHDIAVVEMGASHPGDITKLVEYVEPDCGLITNVGRAHLQGFGSFESVMRTKGELYDYLKRHDGLVFLNESNDFLMQMAADRELERIVSYGQSDLVNVQGEVVGCEPFLRFRWREQGGEWKEVQTRLIGAYNIDNMLAAIAVGLHFGITPAQACHAIESYVPSNNRSQFEQTAHNQLIVDAYNANPTSMAAALDNFEQIKVSSPKMAILGDMRELGQASAEEHQKIADRLGELTDTEVWLVGEEFGRTQCSFRKFSNVEEVKAEIARRQPRGRCILIKGSNGINLAQLPGLL